MRPPDPPKCEHGKTTYLKCDECSQRDKDAFRLTAFLAEEYWESRGERDLNHLMYRAFRLGMKYQKDIL